MEERFRPASPEDAGLLLDLYAPYVENTSITFEYRVPTREEFAQRVRKVTAALPWLVCLQDGRLAGYAYAAPYYTRAAYQWDAELSVYLAPEFQRRGIGGRLCRAVTEIIRRQGYVNLYSLITVPNPGSESLHRSLGFRELAVYRSTGYKLGAWHDVGLWEKQLAPPPAQPEKPLPFPELPPEVLEEILAQA